MIDIVAEGYDAGIRLEEAVPQDMIAVPLTGEIRQLVTATPDYFARHGIPQTPEDLLLHQDRDAHGPRGSTAGSWPVGECSMRWPCRRVLRHPIFCLDPRGQSRAGDWLLPELYIRDELKSGELVSVLNDWTQPFAGLRLYYPSPRPAGVAGAGGDDPRARDYSGLALFSP